MARTVHVTVTDAAEAELAADALLAAGAVAVEERPAAGGGVVLVAGTAAGDDPGRLLAAVAGRWPAEPVPVDLDAALDAWRPYARPRLVGDRLVVRAPWVDRPPAAGGRRDVVIDPGRAFGSGAHPSTRLALVALDRLVRRGDAVLDVGCGSGVLAIAALVLGARSATGVDVDQHAVEATAANAARNAVADRLEVSAGPLEQVVARAPGGYDIVVANMLLPDLVTTASALVAALGQDGRLVVSGLLDEQRDRLLPHLVGVAPVAELSEEGWLALTLQRSSGRRLRDRGG